MPKTRIVGSSVLLDYGQHTGYAFVIMRSFSWRMRRMARTWKAAIGDGVDSFSHTFEDVQHPENCEKEW